MKYYVDEDPTVELLAMALYEMDHNSTRYTVCHTKWTRVGEYVRQEYRERARGNEPFTDKVDRDWTNKYG